MARDSDDLTSAQVVLRPAGGQRAAGPVTAENVRAVLPSPADAERARQALAEAGFQVGPLVANSFSITAPKSTFEKFFKTRLRARTQELPLDALPERVASAIDAITFTPPPDFGPGNP